MSNQEDHLNTSNTSIINKFLKDEMIEDKNEEEFRSPFNNNEKKQLIEFENILQNLKTKHKQDYDGKENKEYSYQLVELRMEQENFYKELKHLQDQLIQEINFLMQKVFDQNKLFYKQQEYQLLQQENKRQKILQSPPSHSYALLYNSNPNLNQYQKYNKEIKLNINNLLQNLKNNRLFQDIFNLKEAQQQQYSSQSSRSPLNQLNKYQQRQQSFKCKFSSNNKMNFNFDMPTKREVQSFWNHPSERKCSITSRQNQSPFEKKPPNYVVEQALYKQSSEFFKFRC